MNDTAKPTPGTITADAIYVHEQTGLTPRQLLEQRDGLLKAARSLCTELLGRGTEPNDGDTSAWDNMQDELAKHREGV